VSFQALAIDWAVQAALALTLAGLLARGQWKQSRAFVAYLATVLVAESTVIFWPERFWTFDWHIARQVAYSTLKLGVAAELGVGLFVGFPAAQRTARGAVLGGLLATFALVVLWQPGGEADHTLIELLLAHGADARLATRDGDTPVELALRFGHAEAAEVLRDARREGFARQQALAQSAS